MSKEEVMAGMQPCSECKEYVAWPMTRCRDCVEIERQNLELALEFIDKALCALESADFYLRGAPLGEICTGTD